MPARRLVLVILLCAMLAPVLRAQDSLGVTPAPADSAAADSTRADRSQVPRITDDTTTRSPTSPIGAFWRSLVLPGWGQAKLDRKLTGAIFVAWEGVTLGMSLKTSHELSYLRRVGSSRVEAKRKERQDWLVLLAFNHLFSALEAYVSSHLWDFPGDLEVRPLPGGGVGGQVSIPLAPFGHR